MKRQNNPFSTPSLPTLTDLRTFFRSHDWSAASLSYPSSRSQDKQSDMEYVKKLLDSQFEKSAREKGLKAPSKYYAKDNSLIVLRDNVEDLISDAVTNLDNDTDRKIFSLYSKGYTQKEIAGKLGYSNNGAVSKRIKHIKETLAGVYARYK